MLSGLSRLSLVRIVGILTYGFSFHGSGWVCPQVACRVRRVLKESSTQSSDFVTKPWGTIPADSLRRFGYVYRFADGSTTYDAPDIEALLSENFIQDHCFRFASGPDSALLGVAFEPTPDRKGIPETAGTVWLDPQVRGAWPHGVSVCEPDGACLRDCEGPSAAGGAMDFVRMMTAVGPSKWEIRIPVIGQCSRARTSGSEASTETFIQELRLQQGTLTLVMPAKDTLWRFK